MPRPLPSFRSAALACGLLASALFSLARPAQAQRELLSKHVPEIVTNGRATAVKPLADSETLDLVLSLPLRHQAELDGLLADLYNPQSPNFRKWLTPEQFDARFGPTEEDYATLMAWAQASGLTITETAPNRHILSVRGTAKLVNRVFHVEETTFHDTARNRDFRAPDREPSTSLSIPLLYVSGLDTSNPRVNHLMKKPAGVVSPSKGGRDTDGKPVASITGSGPNNTYLPSDMRAAYYGSGSLTGTGQTVAIFSYDGYLASDLSLWHSQTNTTSTVPVTNVLTGGFDGGCELDNPCVDGEQILDIVQVQGMAPGLSSIRFYEGLSAVTEINQMLQDNIAKVISSSWGGGDFGPGTAPQFIQMAAQGITYLNATGDDGGFNGFTYLPPSLDPNIVQVGGTDLTTTGAGGPWASETAWGDSGGGYFDPGIVIPGYQQTAGVITSSNAGSATLRNSPDIAAEANFDNTTVSNGSFEAGYGGTSYATPRMAGYLALANQQSVTRGYGTLGFINPQLYQFGLQSNASLLYHDVTSGSAPSSYAPRVTFTAVTGYDLVTGWGSPNGTGLLNALTGPDFTLSIQSSATVLRGASVAVPITLKQVNGFTGTPSFTVAGLPSHITSNLVQNSPTSYTLTLIADATAPYSDATILVTGSSAAITQTVSLSLSVIKRPTADFTLSATNTTVTQQTSANAAVTVNAGSSLAAPVVLSVSNLPAGVTASFDNPSTYTGANITFSAGIAATPGTYPVLVTGTGAGGNFTHSITLALTVAPAPSVLVNGGGETGSQSPWTFTSTLNGGVLCDRTCGYYPHSGNYFFYLNGFGTTDTDVLSQQFAVGGSTQATLNFWLWINSQETTTTAKYDTFTVAVYNTSGTLLGTLGTFSNLNKTSTYALQSYDMTPYLGKTVVLKFTGTENGSRATAFLLDDISVVSQ